MKRFDFFVTRDIKLDLKVIAAKVNAKSVQTFLDDLFLHYAVLDRQGVVADIPINRNISREGKVAVPYAESGDTLYYLRIKAAQHDTSVTNYMASIAEWLVKEHRANGRVWIDDTPVKALPIRTRRFTI